MSSEERKTVVDTNNVSSGENSIHSTTEVKTNSHKEVINNSKSSSNKNSSSNTSVNIHNTIGNKRESESNMIEKIDTKLPTDGTHAKTNNTDSKSNVENYAPIDGKQKTASSIGESSKSVDDGMRKKPLNDEDKNKSPGIPAAEIGVNENIVGSSGSNSNDANSTNESSLKVKKEKGNQSSNSSEIPSKNQESSIIQSSIESSQGGQSSHVVSEQPIQQSLNSKNDSARNTDLKCSEIDQSTSDASPTTQSQDDKLTQSSTTKIANDQIPTHPDRIKVALLLSHRKMILQRLKTCKSAATQRLEEYHRMDKQRNENSGIDALKQKQNSVSAPKLPTKSNHATNEAATKRHLYEKRIYQSQKEEIDEFKELTSFALSFNNRRQSSASSLGGLPGSTSGSTRNISLRTGSSVGNKMKAAVKTLTNSSGWTSSSSPSVESNVNAAVTDGSQKPQSTKKQISTQQQGKRGAAPQNAKHNGAHQQQQINPQNVQNLKYPQEGAGNNIAVEKTTSNPNIIQNNGRKSGIQIASMPKTASSSKKSQQSKKASSTSIESNSTYPAAKTFKTSDENLRPGVSMANNMTIVNGPGHMQHSQQSMQSSQQPSTTSLQSGKKLKKQGKGRRSTSKKSNSPPGPATKNGKGQTPLNVQSHQPAMAGIQKPTSASIGPVSAGAGVGGTYWAHKDASMPMSGHYPPHHFPGQVMHSSMMNTPHFRNGSNQMMIPQQQLPPRILCPETERLRKKRKSIETKLETIFKKRFLRGAMNQVHGSWSLAGRNQINNGFPGSNSKVASMVVPSPKSSFFDPSRMNSRTFKQGTMQQHSFEEKFSSMKPCENQYMKQIKLPHQKLKPLSWKSFMSMGGQSACLLPRRQKTQWDFVLEEMRWLAADFIEERKWKRASSSTISHSIIAHSAQFASAYLSPSRSTHSTCRTKSSAGSSRSSSTISTTASTTRKSPYAENNTAGNLIEIKRETFDENGNDVEGQQDGKDTVPEKKFNDPLDEDLRIARLNAKMIATRVDEKWKLFTSNLNNPKQILSARFARISDSDQKNENECSDSDKLQNRDNNIERKKQCSYEEIIAAMEDSLSYVLKLQSDLPSTYEKYERSCSKKLEKINLELHVSQIKCLQFVETLWNESASSKVSGFLLDGPIASGKTFSACALLWRRRELGPQMLICSSLSMTRWSHELKRFSGLNVISIGGFRRSDNFQFHNTCPKGCDVIVCEVSETKSICTLVTEKNIQFSTIAIDLRCISASNASFDQKNISDISSSLWWSECIRNLLRVRTKTILISSTKTMDLRNSQKIVDTLNSTKDVEMLSLRLAFIQHHLFHSDSNVFAKRVFRWAKKQHFALKNKTVLEGSSRLFNDCFNGKGILSRAMEILTHMHEEVDDDLPSVFPNWFVQFCPLTPLQRDSYERDCNFLRGSLICRNNGSHQNEYGTFAKSLLRLRRSCFISNHMSSADPSNIPNYHVPGHCLSSRKCSQPNIDVALSLLERSSKLQQLFNILCKDCGFDSVDAGVLLTVPQKSVKRKRKKKKVLVLSCLPDILRSTSTFLDSVGICHETILPPSVYADNTSKEKSRKSLLDALCWRYSQDVIAKFDRDSNSGVSTDILLGSPEAVGSMSLGLSAANADVVISLDEDWSGRSNLQFYSVLMKNCIQADSSGGRKYIKLIAEDTCEESFLTFTKKMKARSSVYPIPLFMSCLREARVDKKGFLAVKEADFEKGGSSFYSNVLRCTNVPLSSILCTNSSIPPLSGTGSNHRFLENALSKSEKSSTESSTKADSDLTSLRSNVTSLFDDKENRAEFITSSAEKKIANVVTTFIINVEGDFTRNAWTSLFAKKIFPSNNIKAFKNYSDKYGWSETEFFVKEFHEMAADMHNQTSHQTKLNKPSHAKTSRRKKKNTNSKTSQGVKPKKSSSIDTTTTLSSLLIYSNTSENDEKLLSSSRHNKRERTGTDQEIESKKRKNMFAMSYSSSNFKQDGNQGMDSSIYYPPLFPTPPKQNDENDLLEDIPSVLESVSKKRKATTKLDHTGKKIRSSKSLLSPGKSGISASLAHESALSVTEQKDNLSDLNLLTSSDADFMANTSELFDDDFLPDLTLEKVVDVVEDKVSVKSDPIIVKPDLNEDFGLLGSGTLSSLSDSLTSTMKVTLSGNPHSYWLDPFEPYVCSGREFEFHCDKEEGSNQWRSFQGPLLDSIILRVKTRQRSVYSSAKANSTGSISGMPNSFIPQVNFVGNIKPVLPRNTDYLPPEAKRNTQIVNQITQNKKKKKAMDKRSSSSPMPLVHPPGDKKLLDNSFAPKQPNIVMKHPALPFSDVMAKDREHRKYFTPFFGRPYVLLSKDLFQKVLSSLGPTISKSRLGEHGSSLVFIKPNASNHGMPDDALESICDSNETDFVSPFSTLNFAPFSRGLVNGTESEKFNHSIPACIGINLPMGVKVPRQKEVSAGIQQRNSDSWLDQDDTSLGKCTQRFGRNWHLASQILSGTSTDSIVGLSAIRSPRQCNERWNLSLKKHTDLGTEKSFHPVPIRRTQAESNGTDSEELNKDLTLLSDKISLVATSNELTVERGVMYQTPGKAQFGSIKTARRKRHIIPLTVPGYNNGGNNPSIQTHPSHIQSVQNAVNMASSSSGLPPSKLEMWPLQFLDVAEKQRQNKAKRSTNDGQHNQQGVMNSSPHPPQNMHAIRQPMAPAPHQNGMVQQQQHQQHQQPVRPMGHNPSVRSAAIASPHSAVSRSQEGMQTMAPAAAQHPSSSTYVHPMHPNANRMGNRR